MVDSAWDFYSADEAITMSGGRRSVQHAAPPLRVELHTTRKLEEGGFWTTVVEIASGVANGRDAKRPGGKMVHNEATGTVELFDRTGKLVPLPSGASLPFAMPAAWLEREPKAPPQKSKQTRTRSSDPREWIDNVIADPSRRSRRLAAMKRRFGTPTQDENGRSVYSAVRGPFAVETVYDAARDLIVEERSSRNGVRITQSTYEYTEITLGTFVRTHTRTVGTPNGASGEPFIVEHVLTNVRLERRGGSQ
jgi:hypothetical protein